MEKLRLSFNFVFAAAKSSVHFLVLSIFELKLLKQSISSSSLFSSLCSQEPLLLFTSYPDASSSLIYFFSWFLFIFSYPELNFQTSPLLCLRLSPLVVLSVLMTINIIQTLMTSTFTTPAQTAHGNSGFVYLSSCSLTASIWIFTKHFNLSILKISHFFLLPTLLYHSLHLGSNSIHPFSQPQKLGAVFYFSPLQPILNY